jgi:creatinine amidohydrolase
MERVFIEDMTWPEVRDAITLGVVRVIVVVAAMEQHGPHLAESTDTHLGYAIAGRLARRLGGTLVAPAVTLGFSEMNMTLAGTVSLRASTLEAVLHDVCESLSRHGFREIVLLNAHGGNYPVLRDVLPRLRSAHPTLRIIATLRMDAERAKGFALREGLDIARLGAHAGQTETSMMLAYRPDLVQMDKACEGYIGDLSAMFADFMTTKKFPPIDELSPTGILGDAHGSTRELGERILADRVDYLAAMIETGGFEE